MASRARRRVAGGGGGGGGGGVDGNGPAMGETPLLMLDRWRELRDELYDEATGFDVTKVSAIDAMSGSRGSSSSRGRPVMMMMMMMPPLSPSLSLMRSADPRRPRQRAIRMLAQRTLGTRGAAGPL